MKVMWTYPAVFVIRNLYADFTFLIGISVDRNANTQL